MFKFGSPILLIFISTIGLFGEKTNTIDSLKNALEKAQVDTQKINLLNKIAWESHRSFPDTSRYYAEEALVFAEKINYKKGEGRALNIIAMLEEMNGNIDSSLVLNLKAYEIGQSLNDPWLLSVVTNDLANYYMDIGDQEQALSLYQESVTNMLISNDTTRAVVTYYNLGIFHGNIENNKDRDLYFSKAFELGHQSNDKLTQVHAHNAGAMKAEYENDYEEALRLNEVGLEISRQLEDTKFIAIFLQNLAFVYQANGQDELAIINLQKAEAFADEIDPYSLMYLYYNIAHILNDQERFKESIEYAEKGLMLAEEQKNLTMVNSNLNILSQAYYGLSEFKISANYYKLKGEISDSIYDEKQITLANELEAKFQNKQKGKENQVLLLAQEKDQVLIKQKTFQTRAISIISILTGLLAILAFRAYRARTGNLKDLEKRVKDRTEELEESNKKLKQSNQELEQFAYISSHDLKQPLRNILDFANLLQTKKSDLLDGEANSYIKVISDSSARLDNLINDMLSYSVIGKSGEQKQIDCNEVMAEVLTDLESQIKEKNARIMSDFLPTINGYRSEIHSLFLNLISNSIKYSKPEVKPFIKLIAKEDKTNFNFQIIDNGIGFDNKFADKIFSLFQRLENSSNFEGTGIGLAHCKKIIELHNGKIEASSKIGEGTTISFSIPKNISQ